MANLVGYLVRIIEQRTGIVPTHKTVKLIPITDDKLEFEIPYEENEILGIIKVDHSEQTI